MMRDCFYVKNVILKRLYQVDRDLIQVKQMKIGERNDRGMLVSDFVKWEGLWDIWRDISKYARLSSITLVEIINNMNFSLLD